jgi:hypothetical protein
MCRLGIGMPRRVDQVHPDVVFDYFRHQASDRTPRTSDQLQDLSAAQSLVKCPLDSLDLPANATHPVQQPPHLKTAWARLARPILGLFRLPLRCPHDRYDGV